LANSGRCVPVSQGNICVRQLSIRDIEKEGETEKLFTDKKSCDARAELLWRGGLPLTCHFTQPCKTSQNGIHLFL